MRRRASQFRARSFLQSSPLLCLAMLALLAGCDVPISSFEQNEIFAARLEMTESVGMEQPLDDASDVLNELFGTPDEPRWPAFLDAQDDSQAEAQSDGSASVKPLVALENLQRAAGAVSSDEFGQHYGLFREHCVICHGVAGTGLGATAGLLNPYPRDFRHGKFKFKSTPIGTKPTRQDLRKLLEVGIVGTSMPSFALLEESDLDALVDYVVYLSVRGEVERRLLSMAATELDIEDGDRLFDIQSLEPDQDSASGSEDSLAWAEIEQLVTSVVERWSLADTQAIEVPTRPEPTSDSVANGRALFRGNVAGCAFCHGPDGSGDGQQNNYDDWTRDWTSMAGLAPDDRDALEPMLALGALKPRTILPRNLQLGNFRGGGSPEDLYLRIVNGIEGTPMPAAPMKPDNPQGLTEAEVWDVVYYLLNLHADDSGEMQLDDEGASL